MKTNSVVRDVEQRMNAPKELLAACRMLMEQDTMLDVEATIVATQPEIATAAPKRASTRAALTRHLVASDAQTTRTA